MGVLYKSKIPYSSNVFLHILNRIMQCIIKHTNFERLGVGNFGSNKVELRTSLELLMVARYGFCTRDRQT
jgi:hypothetical protein